MEFKEKIPAKPSTLLYFLQEKEISRRLYLSFSDLTN